MKRCKIGISCELVSKLFKLPKKAIITGAEYDSKRGCIFIYLRNVGKDMPECAIAELESINNL